MKKITFKQGLLIYAGVLLAVIAVLLIGLRGILVKYEKAQAYNTVERFIGDLESDLTFSKFNATEQYIDFSGFSRFESTEETVESYTKAFAGKKFEYNISSKSFDANNPVYIIHSGDLIAGELSLKLLSEEISLDLLSIPTWAIDEFTPELSAIGTSYAINVPKDYAVTVNGILLTEAEKASEENGIVMYLVKGLLKEPSISIKNSEGLDEAFTVEKNAKADRLMNVKTDFVVLNFTIPASFAVETQKPTGITKSGELATYSAVFESMPDAEVMNLTFTIRDPFGDTVRFEDKNGIPEPIYYEYGLECPDTLTARIGSVAVPQDNAVKKDVDTKQYSDVTCILTSSFHTAAILSTEGDGERLFGIYDGQGNAVGYTLENGLVSVPQNDVTITVPDNFKLLIGGAAPDVEPVTKDLEEYEDIKQYAAVPKALTYTLPGQYAPVTVRVTDNRGDVTEHAVAKSLSILEQSGEEALPAGITGVDPLDYGRKWSLFMTNDLDGATNGYYSIRKYIMNGSYLDTYAYAWATGIDITFLGNHVFDNPPFSREKATDFVVFNDSLFYCDVYFVKSFTVTSNGVHRDDIFSKRMYFLNTDDDGDGAKSWVIVNMTDIVPGDE